MDIENLLRLPPYDCIAEEKNSLLVPALFELTQIHVNNCKPYGRGVSSLFSDWRAGREIADLPFVPVSLFKERIFRSIAQEDVFKVLTSSGTTGSPSRIFLDAVTAKLQTLALSQIVQSFIGKHRLPMLIIDTPSVIKDRRSLSARGAGILGMLNFGRNHFYALNDDMSLDVDGLKEWLSAQRGGPMLIFGFTFMVWQYFYEALLSEPKLQVDLQDAVLIHSGGWKKLTEKAVSNSKFKQMLAERTGIQRVHNFYGMVEQVGSVFVECDEGCFHAPLTGDVLIRSAEDLSVVAHGNKGIVQVMSLLPQSYPGHVLLTEDEGTILGTDDCPCGRLGTRFVIHGRLPSAELRGCSDTHASEAARVLT